MKLYLSPGACSLSPHIVLREAGLSFETETVNLGTKRTASGGDFAAVNPKGYVPALELDDGQILTEGPAIVQYLADLRPDSGLAPVAGTLERYRLQEWLTFIGTEIHKQFSALFNKQATDEWKGIVREKIVHRIGWVAKRLDGSSYLMGDRFTVADAYLFTVLRWAPGMGIELSRWPAVAEYFVRVAARPAVAAAVEAEGLTKK